MCVTYSFLTPADPNVLKRRANNIFHLVYMDACCSSVFDMEFLHSSGYHASHGVLPNNVGTTTTKDE